MSAVIKSGGKYARQVVVPFAAEESPPPAQPCRPDPLQTEIERLSELLAQRDAALEAAQAEIASARAQGEAAGRTAAERASDDSREEQLALLRAGIAQARDDLAADRGQMEVLALAIAQTALDKMFGKAGARRDAIGSLVRHQLRAVDRQTVVRVEVSPADFPEVDELAALADEMTLERALLITDAELPAGACRMKLTLGTIDLGLDRQWGTIRSLLDEIAEGAAKQR